MNRKAISKKLRFEVFKRDSFRCRYCSRGVESSILEIDHILPVSKGGQNNDLNLITACFDCNRGKSKNELGCSALTIVDHKQEVKKMKEQRLQMEAYVVFQKERSDFESQLSSLALKAFTEMKTYNYLPDGAQTSVSAFIKSIGFEETKLSADIAVSSFRERRNNNPWKYFCGTCWNKIKAATKNG